MSDSRVVLDSVTVGDILSYFGFEYHNTRRRCPIHDGSNPTAFSFNESGFHCFSCGAKGGKIDLVLRDRTNLRVTLPGGRPRGFSIGRVLSWTNELK